MVARPAQAELSGAISNGSGLTWKLDGTQKVVRDPRMRAQANESNVFGVSK